MELKHLLLLLGRLAVAALAASSALSASANPIDTDNDGVLDDADDCPLSRGPTWNKGCPSNDWDVIATGSAWAEIATCPDGSLAAGFWTCPTYDQGWGTFHVAVFSPLGPYSHTVTLSDEDGDGVMDEDDQCRKTDGDPDFSGCEARTYCMEMDSTYETKCFDWAVGNLSLEELGTYYEGMRTFAEGGCGTDHGHWLCTSIYNAYYAGLIESLWDALGTHLRNAFNSGLTPPSCPSGYIPQDIGYGVWAGVSFPYYSGNCLNFCKDVLFRAGLLTAGASASSVAASAIGKAALGAAGYSVTVAGLAQCDGSLLIEGT